MRWPAGSGVAALAFMGWAAADATPQAEPMAAPSGGGWGASWEPTPAPGAATLPGLPWLQTLVDAAAPGAVVKVPPGRYSGPVVVHQALTLDGGGQVIVDGGGKGTLFTVESNHVTLRGLTFTGSGDSHSNDDTCLNVRGNENTIEDNKFEDCLFGIDLKQANHNRVKGNHIRSKPLSLGLRGDAIRLWYSMDNVVEGNTVMDSRDMVVWYSNGNTIRRNSATRGRYSLHFMYAQHNVVEENHFFDNSVGIYVMYTEGVEIRNNFISHSQGATGLGIGFKEASNSTVEGNDIVYCAVGILADMSPFEPDSVVTLRYNHIAYNGLGMNFMGDKVGVVITGNTFEGNIDHVSQSGGSGASHNTWLGNYWDDFQGFDRNHDGIGDTPYERYAYADRVWMEIPAARFFKNAPLLEVLDFLERLAPFSSPELILTDPQPLFAAPQRGVPHG